MNVSRNSAMYFPIVEPLVSSLAPLYSPQKIIESQNSLEKAEKPFLSVLSCGSPRIPPKSDIRCDISFKISFVKASFDRILGMS